MLNALVASILSCVLILSGASIQLDLNSDLTRGNFQKAAISLEKASQNYHSGIYSFTTHHVEAGEEEENNEKSQQWDDKMSGDGHKKYKSLLNKKFFTAWYQINAAKQYYYKVWSPPQKT